jgi:hypothetical protein
MSTPRHLLLVVAVVLLAGVAACGSGPARNGEPSGNGGPTAEGGGNGGEVEAPEGPPASPTYTLAGFQTYEADGRLWVFKDGSEELHGFWKTGEPAKRVTRIGAGPGGMTLMGPDGETLDAYEAAWNHGRPGFAVFGDDGRLWVFLDGSEALAGFLKNGEPAKRVTRIGAGPDGMTIMSDDGETLDAYEAAVHYGKPGFAVFGADGRLWVFRAGGEALAEFQKTGEPAKRITRIGAGPEGKTIMGAEGETLDSYEAAVKYGKPGFAVFGEDGRLWVFRADSPELMDFCSTGEPAKRVTRVGAGPDGMTIMGTDGETIDAYLGTEGGGGSGMAMAPKADFRRAGFMTQVTDGRLWVFREGSKELEEFRTTGEPAKRVTRVGAGPDGMTLMGPDGETLDSYQAAVKYGKPGFAVFGEDGRLWVFRAGSAELDGFLMTGEPAKRVTRIGSGPDGLTIMSTDGSTIDAYMSR